MKNTQVTVLLLKYSINFRDADDGDCYAGDGERILSVHSDQKNAVSVASEFNSIVAEAEKETTVFPVQKFNRLIKKRFGFVLSDIDDAYNFKLVTETFDVDS